MQLGSVSGNMGGNTIVHLILLYPVQSIIIAGFVSFWSILFLPTEISHEIDPVCEAVPTACEVVAVESPSS